MPSKPTTTGSPGKRGERGQRGERGERGPAGPKTSAADILAVVDDQFSEIRKHLTIQVQRTGQMQVQLDQIHRLVKELLERAHLERA